MRKLLLTTLVLTVMTIAAGFLVGRLAWDRAHEPYKGFAGAEQFVDIPAGASAAEIRRRLLEARVVRDEPSLRLALWWSGMSRSLQAGEYRFEQPSSAFDVVAKLARGEVYTRRLTFPEGLTIEEMAALYDERGFGDAAEFHRAAERGALVADLDPAAADLEGYLFPETYDVRRDTSAVRLVEMMVDRFHASFPEALRSSARAQGLTVRQVVTLASLVEKETARADERPLVAAVYRNRLRIGMGLQADPTVVYALKRAGRYDGNIRKVDLLVDSPYNTYRYPGLPPGPIAAPGRASLEAVLAPADVRHLYFVSRNDGSHAFADTLSGHNANVDAYQVQYFRGARPRRGADEARPADASRQ